MSDDESILGFGDGVNFSVNSNDDQVTLYTLGARGGVLGWYITSPSQGHGQSTRQKPTWYISHPFRMFPTSFPAVFLGQEMVSTFTVFQIM